MIRIWNMIEKKHNLGNWIDLNRKKYNYRKYFCGLQSFTGKKSVEM